MTTPEIEPELASAIEAVRSVEAIVRNLPERLRCRPELLKAVAKLSSQTNPKRLNGRPIKQEHT